MITLILVMGGSVLLACQRDPKKPGYEFIPEMVRAVPYEAFAPNPNTQDGKTLLKPVPGTIPRGYMPYLYKDDRARAAAELKNPLPKSVAVLTQGQHAYETFCLVCHGVMGKGDGPIIPKFPNPPSFRTKNMKALTDGDLYHVITMGSGQMESYASQVAPEDRWTIVHYVRELQGHGSQQEILEETLVEEQSP